MGDLQETFPLAFSSGLHPVGEFSQRSLNGFSKGIVDHGSRLNVALRWLKGFNGWTFLGCVFLAIGQFGRPVTIKTDNHAVFHSRLVKRVLHWAGIRQRFARPASPWENGRIERFFGTLKSCLHGYVIGDTRHLAQALADFDFGITPFGHINISVGRRRPRCGMGSIRTGRRPRRYLTSRRGMGDYGDTCCGISDSAQSDSGLHVFCLRSSDKQPVRERVRPYLQGLPVFLGKNSIMSRLVDHICGQIGQTI